ncbi:hypothetical protein MHY85_03230 [Cellulomonas sp. ACRRI]|uniref:hypothetical protein n=1 Tax=Cellulomonas sp. ACRRI TaxID=2918188 RepID=UPI001EF25935|nr:hypothetical protein [Cellulomonas sp. ACRRI]MCG7284985.1 hypothetical protein [Cellulomonas sp. ACRRI]
MNARLQMQKAPRELQLAGAVAPTPHRSKNVTIVLDRPAASQRRDWRTLLDDRHVVEIIAHEARRAHGHDNLLNDDLESYLTSVSVSVAQRYVAAYQNAADPEDPNAAWYGFLRKALQLEARGHYKSVYGREGSARRAAMTASLDAVLEAAPWREVEARPLVSHHQGPNPGDHDIRGAVLQVANTMTEFTADDVLATVPTAKRATVSEVLRQMAGQGRIVRTVRGTGRGRVARFALAGATQSSMGRDPSYIADAVHEVARRIPRFRPRDVADAVPEARYSSVTSVLSGMARRGVVVRLEHGIYALPSTEATA